ncbi:MAG: hypothetical protein ACO3UM_07755 [Planctomycetota bacterium]
MAAFSVDRWVRSVQRRERWQRAARRALPWIVAVLLAWGSAELLARASGDDRPVDRVWLLAIALVGVSVVLGAALRPRATPWQEIDEALDLDGRLETWVTSRRDDSSAMRSWLQRDLASALPAASHDGRLGRLGWLPMRPLVSALALLLVLLFLGLILPPFPEGVLPLGGGSGTGGAPEKTEAASTPSAAVVDTDGPDSPAPGGAEPPASEPPPPPSLPPEALMAAAQTRDAVVVPSFVGEGPTTRAEVPVVDVDDGARPAGASGFQETQAPRSGGSSGPEAGAPTDPEFIRAAEQAMRSRHVPLPEQAFVRRWFQPKVEGGR